MFARSGAERSGDAAADASRRTVPSFDTVAMTAVITLYIALAAFTRLTFPPFYEDEAWTYLGGFEALRGNGFTWAAFGDGRPLLGLFLALITPGVAISPGGPETGIRIIAAVWGLASLTGAYVLARRLTPALAFVAPALMLATQYVFVATRYGRADVVALALTLWSIAAATRSRPAIAGVLYGLAVSVHPVFMWAAAPCLWFLNVRDRRHVALFVLGAIAGAIPQLLWMAVNRDDVRAIVQRYAVSSSIGADASSGILRSIRTEPGRYIVYFTAQQPWARVGQLGAYVVLPLVALARSSSRIKLILLVLPAILGLALLSQNKNPYYVFTVLPFVAVVSACGVGELPRRIQPVVAIAVLVMAAMASAQYAIWGWSARLAPNAADATAALARELPPNATVVTLNLYAGLIERRPDIQFFNFHALSTRPGWGLPTCNDIPAAIDALVKHDPRHTSSDRHNPVAFVIAPGEPELAAYLQQIYVKSTAVDARCLLGGASNATKHLRVCHDAVGPCNQLTIATLHLPEN